MRGPTAVWLRGLDVSSGLSTALLGAAVGSVTQIAEIEAESPLTGREPTGQSSGSIGSTPRSRDAFFVKTMAGAA